MAHKLLTFIMFFQCISVYGSQVNDDYSGAWSRSGGDNASSRYSSLSQIDDKNIKGLEKSWVFNSGFTAIERDTVQTNPIFTGTLIVTTSLDGRLIALNPKSGQLVWVKNLPRPVARRGLLYDKGYLYVPTGAGIYKINSINGDIVEVIGNEVSYLPPVINGNEIYVANASAGIVKYSITSGRKIWIQKLISHCGSARVWSGFSFDDQLNQLYIATGNSILPENTTGKNCFDNSVIAVDSSSGRLNWIFQEIDNDKWDLDIVGSPIPFDLQMSGVSHTVRSVIGLSKTGSIFLLDANNGRLLNSDKIHNKSSYSKDQQRSSSTKIGELGFNISDLRKESPAEFDYIKSKLKSFKNFEFNYPLIGKPVYFMGIHGGFEWPGAALSRPSNILIATSNSYPWVIRTEQGVRDSYKLDILISNSPNVSKLCIKCHSTDLMGRRHHELSENGVGAYVPAILDSGQRLSSVYSNLDAFKNAHKYALLEMAPFLKDNDLGDFEEDQRIVVKALRKISRLLKSNYIAEINFNIYKNLLKKPAIKEDEIKLILTSMDDKKLYMVKHELKLIWGKLKKDNNLYFNNFWQPFTDAEGFPATKGPWGKLTAIDLNNNKMIWQIPFGFEVNEATGRKFLGSRNFGGAIVTAGGVVIATGTVDEYARAYDLVNGNNLWAEKLPYSGSAPPMTYMYKGCQYILFTATGGRYPWFKKRGDATVAYKLKECMN